MPGPRPQQRDAEDAEHVYIWEHVHKVSLVIVELYDDVRNVATVALRRNPIDTKGRAFVPPKLRDLPVVWPRGGGWWDRRDLGPGDLVLMLVSDRELGPQLLGPDGLPIDGETRRMHALTDGFVVPLGFGTATSPYLPSMGQALIGREDGTVGLRMTKIDPTAVPPSTGELEVEAPSIKLGAGATLPAARQTDKTVADTSMAAHLPAAQTVLVGAAAFLGLTPPPPATDFGVISGGSAKVKIE